MSKILITGNGFDLFHHLPTKYGHFMAVMKTIEKLKQFDELTFHDIFGESFKLLFDFEIHEILDDFDVKKIKFDKSKIQEINQLINQNPLYYHFKNVVEIETWIDFENEIEQLLLDVSSIFNVLKSNPNNYNYYRKDKINVYNDLSCFGFIKEIRQLEVEFKSEFLNSHNRTIKEKLILKNLADSLENFIYLFNRYLTDILYSFYNARIKVKSIPFELIDQIFTFNYTPTLEKLYKVDSSKIIYLHGKSNDNYSLQNLVLGVSEIPSEIKKHKMYDFAKYYQKINKNSNPKFIKFPEERHISKLDETIFYIIGHSLDESDKEYISDLFKFLNVDVKKKSKICIFYFNAYDMQNKIKNLFSIIDKETIINLSKDSRLYFTELTEKNISSEFEKLLFKRQPISIR